MKANVVLPLLAIGLLGSLLAPHPSQAAQGKSDAAATASPIAAHIACKQELGEILALQPAAADAIKRNDIAALTRLHSDIEQRLAGARRDMDRAFLTGAWRAPAARQPAAVLLGEAEAVQMLNFIGLAFLRGYESPTQKVSPSVIDANDKMFLQLGQLVAKLNALNVKKVG